MRTAVVPFVVGAAAVMLSGARSPEAPRHVEAPPTGRTGGFGEPTCLECHMEFPPNAPGGALLLLGLPDVYEPGRAYPLTVRLESEEMVKAGFQLAARFGSGDLEGAMAGLLRPLDGRVAVTQDTVTAVPYAHHTRAGTPVGDPALATWTLEWTAPPTGADALFHAAANSANGDDSPLGDLIYTAVARVRGPSERRRVPRVMNPPNRSRKPQGTGRIVYMSRRVRCEEGAGGRPVVSTPTVRIRGAGPNPTPWRAPPGPRRAGRRSC